MARLRQMGYRGLMYIDDNLTAAATKEAALEWERKVYDLFQKAGWVFKPSKRSGEPAQVCRFLGLEIDSRDLTFNIPLDKKEAIKSHLLYLKTLKRIKVKNLASLVGKLQSVRLATGPIVSVMTRSLYHTISKAKFWSSWVELEHLARYELTWWLENLDSVSKFPISQSLSTTPLTYVEEVASDASGIGSFCYYINPGKEVLDARAFTEQEQGESSTWRELKAYHSTWTKPEVLERFKGRKVAHYTDSQAMVAIISRGSRNPKLHPMVVEALLTLRKYGITVEAVWKPREDEIITWADQGSRDFDQDDISLDFETMLTIYNHFGDFDYDGFASAANTKGKKFFSRENSPGSAGINFFHQKLDPTQSHFCFPPPRLLAATVRHIEHCRATAVCIVPVWANSSFYSIFWPDGRHAANFVDQVFIVRPRF